MNAVSPLIELAWAADADAISLLSRDAVERGLGWSWTAPRVLKALRDDTTNVIVARSRGAISGFAIMRYGEDSAHIVLFAVAAAHRRRGVGSALMAWLEATARTAGIGSIKLEARSGNAEARAFYERLGFAEVGVRVSYYRGVEDAVRFEKPMLSVPE